MGWIMKGCLRLVGAVVALIVLVTLLTHSVLANYRVYGNAMAPALRSGDFVITEKASYRFHSPDRGDIVAFTRPGQPSRVFLMRIVGLGGDHVIVRKNAGSLQVVVNRRFVEAASLPAVLGNGSGSTTGCSGRSCTYIVPHGHVFVLGDNLTNSDDSRQFGPDTLPALQKRIG